MTLFRILALSLLLGSALAGVVWFAWGAIQNLMTRSATAPTPAAAQDSKGPAKEKVRNEKKPA